MDDFHTYTDAERAGQATAASPTATPAINLTRDGVAGSMEPTVKPSLKRQRSESPGRERKKATPKQVPKVCFF